jgi:hypothetical protein
VIISCIDDSGNVTPLDLTGVDASGGADPQHPNFGAQSIILGIQDAQRVIQEGRAAGFKPFSIFNSGLGYPTTAHAGPYGVNPQAGT